MRASVLAFLLLSLVAGCGGSSSETPPPLEPDPTSARYTGPRFPPREEDARSSAAEREPEPEPEDGLAAPARPARATWGSGKAAPKVAPPPPAASPTGVAP